MHKQKIEQIVDQVSDLRLEYENDRSITPSVFEQRVKAIVEKAVEQDPVIKAMQKLRTEASRAVVAMTGTGWPIRDKLSQAIEAFDDAQNQK